MFLSLNFCRGIAYQRGKSLNVQPSATLAKEKEILDESLTMRLLKWQTPFPFTGLYPAN